MTKKLVSTFVVVVLFINVLAQDKRWVFFTDKQGVEFNPADYFDAKAIERRLRNNISLFDSTDFPLNQHYVDVVKHLVDSVGFQSRWFNAMLVYGNEYQMQELEQLPFVKQLKPVFKYPSGLAETKKVKSENTSMADLDFLLNRQINSMGGNLFQPISINGKGVRIAIFDGGFPNVNTQKEFEHLFKNQQIKKTYDFAKKKEDVYRAISHGTMVLSDIAGIWNGKKIGLATNAEFLLAITEVNPEPFVEEEYWLAAAEWADKNGADIINSSLGYTHHRYFREQMDGTSFVAKAANMAFQKGILVVNAAGNEGDSQDWKYIGTPADAEYTLSIGGVNPNTDYHIEFSSYGPTADGRFKPNVSAMGHTVVVGKKGVTDAYGTSFSSPLVAGFAACVLQMNPNYTAKDLFREIQKSASLYPYYDYAHGYGIPQASYFTHPQKETKATFRTDQTASMVKVIILENADNQPFKKHHLYYHIAKSNGFIKKYGVIVVSHPNPLNIDASQYQKGDVLRFHYQGYTQTVEIK